MNLNEIEKKAVQMIARELDGWQFAWNRRVRSNGVCSYQKKTIFLSIWNETRSGTDVINTIKHEIAHALTEGAGHGEVWKETFLALGGNGSRIGSASEAPYTWVMEFEGELVKGYYRKPTVALRKLPGTFLKGRPETKGKLTIRKVNS